ncbi:MAG: hypothetical protein ACREMA_06015 [Longimicrobiales bacterium]
MSSPRGPWELTANQYVALPMIARDDGSIQCLNVLQRTALGLVEWTGEPAADTPLLAPALVVDGNPVRLTGLTWERVDRWIPRFRLSLNNQLVITATICAPTGYDAARRGAFYHFEFENHGPAARVIQAALIGGWTGSFQTAGTPRPVVSERRVALSSTRPGIALELAGSISAALGLAVFGSDCVHHADDAEQQQPLQPGQQRVLARSETATFRASRELRVAPGRRGTTTFYLGIAAEREGALATAASMRRIGAEALIKETRLELSRLSRKTRDAALGAVLNRNLIFAYFFGLARGLDDERLYPVTTRSPGHAHCATFNERDSLLWTLPALLLADPPLVRELLLRCFEQFSHRPGEWRRYIDGSVREPGFALDHWCGYVLAVSNYVDATGDSSLLEEPLVSEVLRELETGIYTRLHPEVFLAETELLPSGDSPDQPFATFPNVLLCAAFKALARLRGEDSEEGKRSASAAAEIAAAIWRRCVADVAGLPVMTCATDLGESASIYDDPAGSLQLLLHYRFCDAGEPIWRATVEFLRSSQYQLWLGQEKYPGLASRSQPTIASLAALCADLLGSRTQEALQTIRELSFAAGVAATHYDPASGEARGDLYDAAHAGLLAWSLHQTLSA